MSSHLRRPLPKHKTQPPLLRWRWRRRRRRHNRLLPTSNLRPLPRRLLPLLPRVRAIKSIRGVRIRHPGEIPIRLLEVGEVNMEVRWGSGGGGGGDRDVVGVFEWLGEVDAGFQGAA